jgi:hypothetical protein
MINLGLASGDPDFAGMGTKSDWIAWRRWAMQEPELERVGLSDRISVPGWVDSAHRSRPPTILALPSFGANFLMSMIEVYAERVVATWARLVHAGER